MIFMPRAIRSISMAPHLAGATLPCPVRLKPNPAEMKFLRPKPDATESFMKHTMFVVAVIGLGIAAKSGVNAQSQSASAPTFSKDVAPILYANCTSCHRPGEIAPMSLLTYADARPYVRGIAAQVT